MALDVNDTQTLNFIRYLGEMAETQERIAKTLEAILAKMPIPPTATDLNIDIVPGKP